MALVALAAVGAWRVRLALMPAEDAIQRRIESVMDALEDRQPKRLTRALVDDFVDEDTGYRRRDVVDASRSVLAPGSRYRATLDPDAGIEFLEGPAEVDGVLAATVRVRCAIEVRYGKDQPYGPFWDLEFTADMERRSGTWMFVRTRDVNHGDRPGR